MPESGSRLAAACLLVLTACGAGGAPDRTAAPALQRVVVLGPSTTETMFALELGRYVVGVSDYCVEARAADLPRVGGQLDPALERIAALDPDLVIVQGGHPRVEEWCAQAGAAFLPLATDSWDAWLEEVELLGDRFGAADAADRLIQESRDALGQVRRRAASPGESTLTKIVVYRHSGEASGILVAGAASFLSELLEAAGGENLFHANPGDYFDLNEEALLQQRPEVILELNSPDEAPIAVWRRAFPDLPAVRDDKVYPLDQDFILLPGPRMVETAELIADLLADGRGQ